MVRKMENQTKINELESKLNSVFGDINKYYSDFNQKVSLFLFNKELLNELSSFFHGIINMLCIII